jgi:hypothetical protein
MSEIGFAGIGAILRRRATRDPNGSKRIKQILHFIQDGIEI